MAGQRAPELRELQLAGIDAIQQESLQVLSGRMGNLSMPTTLLGPVAACALVTDRVRGTESYAIRYRAAGMLDHGRELLAIFDDTPADSAHDRSLDFVMPMLNAGKIDEAAPYLESLAKSAPASAPVLYNLGIAYSELGQYDEAIIRLKRAVRLDPIEPTIHNFFSAPIQHLQRRNAQPTPYSFLQLF